MSSSIGKIPVAIIPAVAYVLYVGLSLAFIPGSTVLYSQLAFCAAQTCLLAFTVRQQAWNNRLFLGMSSSIATSLFTILQTAFGVVAALFLRQFFSLATAISVVLLVFALVTVFLLAKSTEHIKTIEEKATASTTFCKTLVLDLEDLRALALEDGEISQQLGNLIELARYSDPMSSEGTASVEHQIQGVIQELQANPDRITKKELATIARLLESRNRRLRAGK